MLTYLRDPIGPEGNKGVVHWFDDYRAIWVVATHSSQDFFGLYSQIIATHPLRIVQGMGSGMRITCDSCDIEKNVLVGIGFSGVAKAPCACDSCKSIVSISRPRRPSGNTKQRSRRLFLFRKAKESAEEILCATCSGPVRLLEPMSQRDRSNLGRCPCCSGNLRGVSNNIRWD